MAALLAAGAGLGARRAGGLLPWRRAVRTTVAELRKGDCIEYEQRPLIVHNVHSTHSGRATRQFMVWRWIGLCGGRLLSGGRAHR